MLQRILAVLILCASPAFTVAAAQDGAQLFATHCIRCHVPIEMQRLVHDNWAGRSADQLYVTMTGTMPAESPGSLAEAEYLAILTYLLELASIPVPAGDLAAAGLASIPLLTRQSGEELADDVEWRTTHGELNANRYAPLSQINAMNAAELEIAWQFSAANFGPIPEVRSVSIPIVRHGQVFVGAGITRNVISLDAETGQLLWMWRPVEGERFNEAARKSSGMGVAYWEGTDGRRRVITVTPGYFLASLNAATGNPDPEFGAGGLVDLTQGLRRVSGRNLDVGLNAPPLVVGDVIVVGSAHAVSFRPPSKRNVKGDVRGFDARSGKLLWTFHTIPQRGEPGYETWLNGSAEYTGNASVWAPMSADEELGLVYLPVESATGDQYGGDRHGANLYANSLVALDVRSGAMRWHFQLIHHDIWDWDTPTAPVLADLPNGRKLVAQPTKQSWVYVFDRETGEPIWPIEERAVPQTDVPGEWTSPTQPFPALPAPFDRQGTATEDFLDYTPEIRAEVAKRLAGYRLGPIYTPPSLADAADGTRGTLMLPYSTGGANFEGSAYDPGTGILYVPSQTRTSVMSLEHDPEASDIRYIAADRRDPTVFDLPIVKPPWGRITAIDLATGKHLWSMANGDTPQAVLENPALAGIELPRTGKQTRAGVVVTDALLFAGEGFGGDAVFRAHDKLTGKIVAEIALPATQSSAPVSYFRNGRQYILMHVADSATPARLVALALPKTN
jgi:quinoprotein glucose dehydrogenase